MEVQQTQSNWLETMAKALDAKISTKSIFGEPIEKDGVTVIPVAKARTAFGGGGGSDETKEAKGGGGGGGLNLKPLGFIEISGTKARFRRIWEMGDFFRLAFVGMASLMLFRRVTRNQIQKVSG